MRKCIGILWYIVCVACTNVVSNNGISAAKKSLLNPTDTTNTTTTSTGNAVAVSMQIVSQEFVSINNTAVQGIKLFLQKTSDANDPVKICDLNSNPACQCKVTWSVNSSGAAAVDRTIYLSVLEVQSSYVICGGDASSSSTMVFQNEIPIGGLINVFIIKNKVRLSTIRQFPYATSSSLGALLTDFKDSLGNSYISISHYACAQTSYKPISLSSFVQSVSQDPAAGSASASPIKTQEAFSSHFKVGLNQPSAHTYYYNLYMRRSETGQILESNPDFICPKVDSQFWPLDRTFALALLPNAIFTIGVQAPSQLLIPGAAYPSQNTTPLCRTGDTKLASPNGIFTGCLGFAAAMNADGTCPSFQDENIKTIPTYRLRRFVALFPRTYGADGYIYRPDQLDTIYVLDRPTSKPNITLYGPKPCPYAYYNAGWVKAENNLKCVTGTASASLTFQYLPTWSDTWTGNIDGSSYPNRDILPDSVTTPSCAATVPLFCTAADGGQSLTLAPIVMPLSGTPDGVSPYDVTACSKPIASFSKLYVRPYAAFWPHYEEDVDFKACAPRPSAGYYRDPPLQVVNSSAGSSYCSVSYPSYNTQKQAYLTAAEMATQGEQCPNVMSYTFLDTVGSSVCNPNGRFCTPDASVKVITTAVNYPIPLTASISDLIAAKSPLWRDPSYRCNVYNPLGGAAASGSMPPCCAGVTGSNQLFLPLMPVALSSAYIACDPS